MAAGRLHGAGPVGIEAGKVVSTYKTAKHFDVAITDDSLIVTRRQEQIDAEAALDGFYVLRTPVPASELDAPGVVTAYKNLKYVERDFRHIKADDLDLRPVFHHLEERVRAHVLICMLACYLTWHLRRAWAPLTVTDQQPAAPASPVAPARRSGPAVRRGAGQGLRPVRPRRAALPQLPRPDRTPGDHDPQPGPVRRHQRHRAHAGRADPHPATGVCQSRRRCLARREGCEVQDLECAAGVLGAAAGLGGVAGYSVYAEEVDDEVDDGRPDLGGVSGADE